MFDPAHTTEETDRPFPVAGRTDLIMERVEFRGEEMWVIKDPIALKYFRMEPEQYQLIQLLDGSRSLDEIQEVLQKQIAPKPITRNELIDLIVDLSRKNLVTPLNYARSEQVLKQSATNRSRKVFSLLINPLFIRLPGWDPSGILRFLKPLFGWMYSTPAVVLFLTFVAACWSLLGIYHNEFRAEMPRLSNFFAGENLLLLWLAIGISKAIHELSHALSCQKLKGETHEIGLAFLVFSPCLYCDVSDSWMFRSKWKRIAVSLAGIYAELILSAIAILIWLNTFGGFWHTLAMYVFLVTSLSTILVNANPLLKYDGYYVLSDWLEIPNLREKSVRVLDNTISSWFFGKSLKADPFLPEKGRGWFLLYAIASAAYSLFLIVVIAESFRLFLKPYGLDALAILFIAFSVSGMIYKGLRRAINMFRKTRERRVKPVRVAFAISGVIAVVAVVHFIPFPNYGRSPLLAEPKIHAHIYAPANALLQEVRVRPGQTVKEGAPLVWLRDDTEEERLRLLQIQSQLRHLDKLLYEKAQQPDNVEIAIGQIEQNKKQIAEVQSQIERLAIYAPSSGVIVAANQAGNQTQKSNRNEIRLASWSGDPLDPSNSKAFIQQQTHLLSIADPEKWEAVLYVTEENKRRLQVGQVIDMRFDSDSSKVIKGKITMIASRHEEEIPQTLSSKFGGPIVTKASSNGSSRAGETYYQAIVSFKAPSFPVVAGLRGEARFLLSYETLTERVWRMIQQAFVSRF